MTNTFVYIYKERIYLGILLIIANFSFEILTIIIPHSKIKNSIIPSKY